MPMEQGAKKAYQKEYMRKYQQSHRSKQSEGSKQDGSKQIPSNVKTPSAGLNKPDVKTQETWEHTDYRDRRNYSEVYLKCLDAQGGVLTEASAPLIKWLWPEPVKERRVDPAKRARAMAVLKC